MNYLFFKLPALLVVFLFPLLVFSQQLEIDLPETWSDPLTDESFPDPSVWSDLNEWYSEHPVYLPNATRAQLLELPGMDGLMAEAILNYQSKPGFENISDISLIPEISSVYYSMLQHWVTMDIPNDSDNKSFRVKSESRHRTRLKSGNSEISSLKSFYIYNRFRIQSNTGWMGGIISEKDKEETNFSDYLNGTIYYKNPFPSSWVNLNKFSAGSFQLAFGEGLLFSRSATMGKSSSVISSPVRNSNGLSPSLSSDENRYLFGSASSILFPEFGIESGAFYSSRRYDGKSEWRSSFDENENIRWNEEFSFDYSGLHTDSSSLSKKDQLPVKMYGGWVEWSDGQLFSLTGVGGTQEFGSVIPKQDSSLSEVGLPDRSDRFQNMKNMNRFFSVSAQITTQMVIFSAEISKFQSRKAFAGWILAEPIQGFKYILHHRDADPGFTPLFGRPFADKMSSPGNETGWYQGLEVSVNRYLFSFYRDEYRHPWPGYLKMYPSEGIEWFAGIEKRWKRQDYLKIQIRHSIEKESENSEGLNNQSNSTKTRVEWNTQLLPSVQLKFRADLNQSVKNFSGKGFTAQMKLKILENGRMVFQGTWFDASIYDDRIYVYESDLPGMMSFNPLYGEGVRLSLLAGNKILDWFSVAVKGAFEYSIRITEGTRHKKSDGFLAVQADFTY